MKTLSFTLLCLLFWNASAQKNFQPGFVVNVNGDTIRGQIDYERWDRNPMLVTFSSDGIELTKFRPNEIRSFFVANEFFESAVVEVDISPYKLHELNESSVPQYVRDTVFLQSVVRGEKSLFRLKDRNEKNHFYIFNNGMQPLVYKPFIILDPQSPGVKKFSENNKYKGQLTLYLDNCSEIKTRMRNLKYEQNSLTKLFLQYYKCQHNAADYVSKRKDIKVGGGLLIGASWSTITFRGGKNIYNYIEYNSSTNPSFGGFVDFKLIRSKRLTISNDLFYCSMNLKGNGFVPRSANVDTIDSRFNLRFLKTHHQLRINLGNVNGFYISGGFSTNLMLKKDTKTDIYNGAYKTSIDYYTNNFSFGEIAAVGYRFVRFSTEVRVEMLTTNPGASPPGATSPETSPGAKIYSAYAFLKYTLF